MSYVCPFSFTDGEYDIVDKAANIVKVKPIRVFVKNAALALAGEILEGKKGMTYVIVPVFNDEQYKLVSAAAKSEGIVPRSFIKAVALEKAKKALEPKEEKK